MRVADVSTSRSYLEYLNKSKSDVMKTQEQIATGARFTEISDDVAAGTRVLYTRMDRSKTEVQLENVKAINDELEIAEDVMLTTSDILTRVHELTIRALSEDKDVAGRDAIAEEIKSLKDQILNFTNTKFGEKFVFGGSNSSVVEPFTVGDDGRIQYNGIAVDDIMKADAQILDPITNEVLFDVGDYYYDNGGVPTEVPMDEDVYMDVGLGIKMTESQVDESSAFKISYSGLDIFGFGTTTDPETGNVLSNNIYNIIQELEESIRNYDTELMGEIDKKVLTVTDTFRTNITDIGAKTDFLNTMETKLDQTVQLYDEKISGLMGTNDEEAIIRLEQDFAVLSAIQRMGSRIIPSTLMDFIT